MFRTNPDGSLKLNSEAFGVEIVPGVVALARTVDPTISASAEIVLNVATRFIQVYAITKDVYLKWGADDVSASNFDEVIPAGQIKNFIVPENMTAINLIEREATAGVIVIEK